MFNQGWFCPQRTLAMFADIFVLWNSEEAAGIQWVECMDAAEYPMMHWTATAPTKNYRAQDIRSAQVEKPCSRTVFFKLHTTFMLHDKTHWEQREGNVLGEERLSVSQYIWGFLWLTNVNRFLYYRMFWVFNIKKESAVKTNFPSNNLVSYKCSTKHSLRNSNLVFHVHYFLWDIPWYLLGKK